MGRERRWAISEKDEVLVVRYGLLRQREIVADSVKLLLLSENDIIREHGDSR